MDDHIFKILARLEAEGVDHDANASDHGKKMLNITHDTGEFLTVVVTSLRPSSILEIGTSNGYSTIWLAAAARCFGGEVVTVELSENKIALASSNFEEAGLKDIIRQIHGNAKQALSECDDSSIGLIFLDSDRRQYAALWPDIKRTLRAGGLLVVDNASSHADEIQPLLSLIDGDSDFVSSLVQIGKGELLAAKR